MQQLTGKMYLQGEAKAWLRYCNGTQEVVKVLPAEHGVAAQCYEVYTAYDQSPAYLGSILFDQEGYWIYDGDLLQVDEQEQLANFIVTYVERL